MVESEQLVDRNEDELRIVGEQESQAAAIKIIPAAARHLPPPPQDEPVEGEPYHLSNGRSSRRETGEEKILNGACGGGTAAARPSWTVPPEESLPLKTDIETGSNRLGGEGDSLPSPGVYGPSPPDGGLRAWMVMLASFLCNGIIFGTINSGGLIFVELLKILEAEGNENPAAISSITLSLAIGNTFSLSLVAGVLTDKLGIRVTTIVGGTIATLGMFLSSIYYTQPNILITTMGILFGTGASLAYTPSLVILGHYFYKRMGIVNGFVTAGSSLFTIIMPELLQLVIETHGLKTVFQMLSGLMSILVLCGFIFKPLLPDLPAPNEGKGNRCRNFLALFINFEIWKNKRYVIWTLAIPTALFGYFVPYVHLVKYVKNTLGENVNSKVLVQCIGGASGIGRILFGHIADKPWVNRIVLQQISFFSIGTLTMLLTGANQFWMLVVISLGMGIFDGCFISLLGPIAFDIVGPAGASQAIGCLLAFCSIPLTIGPFVAGVMYDHFDSYLIPFLCAGIPPILGSLALFLLRCVKEPSKGGVGSPVRDSTEMKNNVAVANPDSGTAGVPEAQALMPADNQPAGNDMLQVDVKFLYPALPVTSESELSSSSSSPERGVNVIEPNHETKGDGGLLS